MAAPTGGRVTAGSGSISHHGATTTIHQTSHRLSLSWKSFNVDSNETVNFRQPSSSAVAINRISDTQGSTIMGHINANGNIYLINPNGIVFGASAQVNVGGLVASTLDTADGNHFAGTGQGAIVNEGTIKASHYVALLANSVTNSGVITARLGTVAMGAGDDVSLTFAGNNLVRLQVNRNVINSLVVNHGLIEADGGMVVMNAGARDTLLASVVNNDGVVQAQTVNNKSGVITLLGGMAAGTVNVGGTLDASAPNGGDGGSIETSAAHVQVADGATVDTQAASGQDGSWLIDPVDFIIPPAILAAHRGHVVIHTPGGQGNGNLDNDTTTSTTSTTTTTASTTTTAPTTTTTTTASTTTAAPDTTTTTSTTTIAPTITTTTTTAYVTAVPATIDMTAPLTDAEDVVAVSDSLLAQPMLAAVDAPTNGDVAMNGNTQAGGDVPLNHGHADANGDAHANGGTRKGRGKRRQKHHRRGDVIASEQLVSSGMLHVDGVGIRLPSGTI